jgi:hypothetical protein
MERAPPVPRTPPPGSGGDASAAGLVRRARSASRSPWGTGSPWIGQQFREAFPDDTAPRYLILDRDRKNEGEAAEVLRSLGRELIRAAYQSPWQNGVAERWVGSCRRELLGHVIVFNETHLRRLVREYLGYYHKDRIHDSLEKDTPTPRPIERRSAAQSCGRASRRRTPPSLYVENSCLSFRERRSMSIPTAFSHHCAMAALAPSDSGHSFRSHNRASVGGANSFLTLLALPYLVESGARARPPQ